MTKKEALDLVRNTKVYVGKNSREIQEKLFSIGYKWEAGDSQVKNGEFPFIYIHEDIIARGNDMNVFNSHENKEISAEDILNIKVEKEYNLKPFDKVLARYYNNSIWRIEFFGRVAEDHYLCMSGSYKECIPYNEETAHLLGTKEDYYG